MTIASLFFGDDCANDDCVVFVVTVVVVPCDTILLDTANTVEVGIARLV